MSDFAVKITVRNARLLRLIRAEYGTSSEMSRQTGIAQQSIAGLLTMRRSPIKSDGDWTKAAYDISSAVRVAPEQIWPQHIARIKLRRNEAEVEMSADEIDSMISAENHVAMREMLTRWSAKLSDREARAIAAHADGATLEEIGTEDERGATKERARQILMKAHRKIRIAAARDGVRSFSDIVEE